MGVERETEGCSATTIPPVARRVVAQRYELIDLLGRGGFGEVWRAHDLASRDEVAIKLLDRDRIAHPVRVRREIAALRRLRVPGVVRLLDEGLEGTWTFIAMELVAGKGFPGAGVTSAADVLRATSRLLEVLARVHAQGVVHRDLKPANVLVDDKGRVTLLDFGIAIGVGEARISVGYDILGTPAYLAPEQVSGEPIGPRADLYAVGVMLFEALTGELPFEAELTQAIYYQRLYGQPRKLRALRPDLPAWLGDLVAQLLARSPQHRPRNAAEVVARLRAGGAVAADAELPFLGRAAALNAVEGALRAGRSTLLRGQAGCGGTRFLRVLAERLRASGREVHELVGGGGSFAALRPLLDADAPRDAKLDDIRAHHVAAVTRLVARGGVILVDDLAALDGASARVLQRCAAGGGVVALARGAGALDAAAVIPLGPLGPEDLAALFNGPERIFHLVSDGAALLMARTEGMPGAVAAEIEAWCSGGFASWDGARLTLDRDALERITLLGLARGVRGLRAVRSRTEPPSEQALRTELPAGLEGVLDAVLLATSPMAPTVLGAVLDLAGWEVEAALEDLSERGLVSRVGDGCAATSLASAWDVTVGGRAQRRARIHRGFVSQLPPGDERRLHHFLSAHGDVLPPDTVGAFVGELLPVAAAFADGGRTERARVLLEDGVATIRRSCELSEDADVPGAAAPHLLRVLEAWVPLALTEMVPRAMDRVLHELARVASEYAWGDAARAATRRLDRLVRAALTVPHAPSRALSLADEIAPFDVAELELARHAVRVRAARAVDVPTEAAVIDSVAAWCEARGGVRERVSLLMWRSMQHYRLGRFDEAAACSVQAAALAPDVMVRIAATADAAAACLEAFRLEDAATLAEAVTTAAALARQPYFEAMGTWAARTSAYRLERPLAPDRALVDEVALLAVPHLEALLALTEATFALRAGDLALCRTLAGRMRARWREAERADFANLGAALEVHAGGAVEPGDLDELLRWAVACEVPGVGLQALALLRGSWPAGWRPTAEVVEALSRQVPSEHWTKRIDVLSAEESRALIGAALATGPTGPTGEQHGNTEDGEEEAGRA